ncbi:importin-alpha export receptor [Malassezia cuniculi]|uniref:Importin-alpha export receptor n=1 Tax=Malassezia cuniculi TaxID=948313 RepID=A0AAF0EYL8_9BASI|nr:importin-alpha export receptor [Malassezia cuniculi]
MDHTDPQQLAQLATLFQQTLQPEQRRAAEEQLGQLCVQPRFALLLLALIQSDTTSTAIRLAAAIQFKNLCKLNWAVDENEDDQRTVSDDDKAVIRAQLTPLLVSLAGVQSPSQAILAQLNESIALIARSDFPDKWQSLIDELVAQLSSDNYHVILSVLATSHAIFRRWRSMFRSDALYTEINLVLEKFAVPLLELLGRVHGMLVDPATPAQNMVPLANCLVLLLQLFYDLSAQDLPPQFEDAIPNLSPLFTSLLSFSRAEIAGEEDDVAPAPLDKIRSSVCEIFELYAKRYLDVLPQLPEFVQAVWNMLSTYGASEKYDVIVSKAIGFLAAVVRMGSQRSLFEADATLEQLCSAIVLPNMQLREVDEEIFEDNPMEYIRRDLETSIEADTRRRAASEFVRSLLEQFGPQVTAIASRYISEHLAAFRADPNGNWKRKDTAIYLLTSIAAQGASTQHGVSSTNTLVDVVQFFSEHVLQDLQPDNLVAASNPILQVDAIKYLYTFRNQLTKEQLLSVLPLLVHHLAAPNYVTRTYAAIAIERVLFLRSNGSMLFSAEDVQPFAEEVLRALFSAIERGESPEKVAENDHLMKCAMRVLLTARHVNVSYTGMVLEHLVNIISVTSRNPSNPRFTQFLFETLAALVRFAGTGSAAQLSQMETAVFGPFTHILQADVAEYIPYVFQIMAQLLEAHAQHTPGEVLPPAYASLLPPLLMPALWEQKGNVPALVRLLKAYLAQAPEHIVNNGHVEALLGVYQKLISSRLNDVFGFDLLLTMLRRIPTSVLGPYMQPILTLMLTRLQNSKTERFSQHFCAFFGAFCGVQQPGYPSQVIAAFDTVQPGLFAQILANIVVSDTAKLSAKQRFGTAAGLIRLLTESTEMLQPPNSAAWGPTLGAVVRLLASAPAADDADPDAAAELDEQGFQASFSQLAASLPTVPENEAPWAGNDLCGYLAKQLSSAAQRSPGVISPLIQSLPQDEANSLSEALKRHGVTL